MGGKNGDQKMSGVKGKSGGNRGGSGRKKLAEGDRLVKVIGSVLPDTLTTLRIVAAKQCKGRAARHTAFGASLLNEWAADRVDWTEQASAVEDLPGPREARRVQITLWIKKPTAQKIYNKSLDKDSTRSAIAGQILDVWAARAFKEAARANKENEDYINSVIVRII